MEILEKIIIIIENFTKTVGRTVSWLIIIMVLVALSVVILRYFFNIGFVWMQEIYVWFHGIVFLFGASYTLMHDKHVRVDIFYRPISEKKKAFINLIFSILFILPFIFIISKYSIPYILKSWISLERSREAGGLPFLYIYKTSLIFFCFLLFFQTIALIFRCLLVISNKKSKIFFNLKY